MTKLTRFFYLTVIVGCLSIAATSQAQDDTLKVLFIGNSHTYVNDVPALFRNLSQSGGHFATTDMSAPGGYTLEQHTTNATTLNKIAQGPWDYVVLQEQSLYPVIEYYRYNSMYPAARFLDSLIHYYGSNTALYMTWGWRDGGQHDINGHYSPEFRDFFHMQDSMSAAYTMLAEELDATLSPAGNAWTVARRMDETIDLWQADTYHATLKGSYLAACVFYAVFWQSSPIGLSYTAGLTPEEALFLQQAADQATTGIEDEITQTPNDFRILSNYPNPFNGITVIEYAVKEVSPVSLAIYDIAGRKISSLVNEPQGPGAYRIAWHAKDLPTGIYFLRAKIGENQSTRKMLFLK